MDASSNRSGVSRRNFLSTGVTAAAGLAALGRATANSQDFFSAQPTRYPDARIVVLDKKFAKYKLGNTVIQRLYYDPTMLWAEGCAWNAVGKYLLWSDIPNDRQSNVSQPLVRPN